MSASTAHVRSTRLEVEPEVADASQIAATRTVHPAMAADPSSLLDRRWSGIAHEPDLRATNTQITSFRRHALIGDPLADALVEAMFGPGGPATTRAAIEDAFHSGLVADRTVAPEVADYFEAATATPYWVDPVLVRKGQAAIARAGVLGMVVLGDFALMGGYLSRRGIKPLMMTGELKEMAPRRLAETANWWIEVTTPGSLEPGGDGIVAALRVRLTHAHIRRWLNQNDQWDHDQWDSPINQIQLAGTHLLFSVACMGGLQRLGMHYDKSEREAITHLWRYIGWLMGIDESLLPATEADCWRLYWLMAATELNPDDDSQALAQALLGGITGALGLPRPVLTSGLDLNGAISRYLIGDPLCDELGLPGGIVSKAVVQMAARVIAATEIPRRVIPGGSLLATWIGQRTRTAVMLRAGATLSPDHSYHRAPATR